jgi:hypothetical protein
VVLPAPGGKLPIMEIRMVIRRSGNFSFEKKFRALETFVKIIQNAYN